MMEGLGDDISNLFGGDSYQVRQGAQITPPVKVLGQYTERVFRTQLAPFTRAVMGYANPDSPNFYSAIGTGNCNLPDSGDHPILVGYDSVYSTDEYGFDNEGGPMPQDDAQMTETSPGNSIISGLVNPVGRQNVFQSDTIVGRGVGKNNYGAFKYQDRTTPTGKASRIKKKPRLSMLLGEGMYFTQTTNALAFDKGGNEQEPPSSNPKDNTNASIWYATVDLARFGDVNKSGIDFDGDDHNGLLVQVNQQHGLVIEDGNKLGVKVDNFRVFFNDHGELTSDGGTGDEFLAGRAIILATESGGSSGSDDSSGSSEHNRVSINVDLAEVDGKARAGLCDVGGDDQNGLMVNLLAQNPAAVAASGGLEFFSLKQPVSYPSFMPQQYRSVFSLGYRSYQAGWSQDNNPHTPETPHAGWWRAGFKQGERSPQAHTLFALPSPGEGGSADPTIDPGPGFDTGPRGSSVEPVPCGGVTTGSGLTIVAGDGNQMAVWLAKYRDGSSVPASGSGGSCDDMGAGLAFLGDDGEGLGILLQSDSGLTLNESGLAACVDGETIGIIRGRLATLKRCADCLELPPPTTTTTPPYPVPGDTPPGTICQPEATGPNGAVTTVCTTTTPGTGGSGSGSTYTPPTTIPGIGTPPPGTPAGDPGVTCAGVPATVLPLGSIHEQFTQSGEVADTDPPTFGAAGFSHSRSTHEPSIVAIPYPSPLAGSWLQGHATITTLSGTGYQIGFAIDPTDVFGQGANLDNWAIVYDGSTWRFHNTLGHYVALQFDYQPGADCWWALHYDCTGTAHFLLGASETEFTEVYQVHDPTISHEYAFRVNNVLDPPHLPNNSYGGPAHLFAEIDHILSYAAIPMAITIHNYNGGGTTHFGDGTTMPNPDPAAMPTATQTATTTTQPPLKLDGNLDINGTLFSVGQNLNGIFAAGIISSTDFDPQWSIPPDLLPYFLGITDPVSGNQFAAAAAIVASGTPGSMSGGPFWPGG